MMVKIGVIFLSFSNPYVKSAVSLKWQVGFENDMKIALIFTVAFSSKMLIRQFFTSLEYTFLVNGL